ncbi:hypothetical protein J6590_053042 [Homalodisca vitripennis]|nr:hypothetical protein J6590_053042 [Homalodisca vitripennis]
MAGKLPEPRLSLKVESWEAYAGTFSTRALDTREGFTADSDKAVNKVHRSIVLVYCGSWWGSLSVKGCCYTGHKDVPPPACFDFTGWDRVDPSSKKT